MNRNYYLNDEIKLLRFICIAHYLIIIVSLYLYYMGLTQFYYSSKIYYGFMNYSLIFKIIYIFIPSLLLLLSIPSLKKNLKFFKFLKYLTFSILIISFIVGILICISVWKTSTEAVQFKFNCPYHFSQSLLKTIINKEKNKNGKDGHYDICDVRICTLYSEDDTNDLSYNYLCNYNSLNDFEYKNDGTIYKRINSEGNEISSQSFIQCSKIKSNTFSDDEFIKNYLNLCNKNAYYNCALFEKPKENDINSVNNKELCPGINYEKTAYLLSVSFMLIDIICFDFLFFVEYIIMINLIKISQIPEENSQIRENVETINSTVKNKSNQQNSNINENNNTPEYQKEPTQTIIVAETRQNENEDILTTPIKSENDEMTTGITQKEGNRIQNLKTKSNIKLLNLALVDSEKRDIYNENENGNENGNEDGNENDNNKKLKLNNRKESIKKKHKKINIRNTGNLVPNLDLTLIRNDKEIKIYSNKNENNNDKKDGEFQEKSKEEEDSKDKDYNRNVSVIQEEKTQKIEFNDENL